jgi:hypothetical protein
VSRGAILLRGASLHRQLRGRQCRRTWDTHRSLCTLGRAFQQRTLQSVFQNGFSLRRGTSGSSHRQRCNNQGSSEWSYCTSSQLSDSVPVSLCGQDAARGRVVMPSAYDLDKVTMNRGQSGMLREKKIERRRGEKNCGLRGGDDEEGD